MTKPQNMVLFLLMFCSLVIFIKNVNPINIRRPWAPEITMFCSEVIMTKTFKLIKTRRPWPSIWFHIFFSKAYFSSWPLFFTPGVFLYSYCANRLEKKWLYLCMYVYCVAKFSINIYSYSVVGNLWLAVQWYTHMLWLILNGMFYIMLVCTKMAFSHI